MLSFPVIRFATLPIEIGLYTNSARNMERNASERNCNAYITGLKNQIVSICQEVVVLVEYVCNGHFCSYDYPRGATKKN